MLNNQTETLVKLVRTALAQEIKLKSAKTLIDLSDDDLVKFFFKAAVNLEDDESSCSLTTKGVKVLEHYFRSWEIKLTKPLSARQHLILMRNCGLPYYIDKDRVVVFDREVGVLLKLSQGNNDYIEQMFPD